MAYVAVSDTAQTSISVYLADMDATYPTSDRVCDWYLNGTFYGSVNLYAYASSGGFYTFYGLTAGTRYTITALVYTASWTATFTGTATTRAPTFAWTYPKISGGNFNLTADEWNRLWDAIETRLGYSYYHTRAYPGNTFTATMYNQAVNAIGKGTTVSIGDTITASLMNALVTNVNNMV